MSRRVTRRSGGVLWLNSPFRGLHFQWETRQNRISSVREVSPQAPIPPRSQQDAMPGPGLTTQSGNRIYQPPSQSHRQFHGQVRQDSKAEKDHSDQGYPLYPSVIQLLHENNIDVSDVGKIPATGPNGRLLKGDVLAYLGTIEPSYVGKQSQRIADLTHLDLSNIKVARERKSKTTTQGPQENTIRSEASSSKKISIAVSFQAVNEVRHRLHSTLGIEVPLETFISQAVDISNHNLPRSISVPTADKLFDEVIGFSGTTFRHSRGTFAPQITTSLALSTGTSEVARREPDILDVLINTTTKPTFLREPTVGASSDTEMPEIFSVMVAKDEERRASVFLERVKSVLETNPGRLVCSGSPGN